MIGACICYDCLQDCSLQIGFQWWKTRKCQNQPQKPRTTILVSDAWSDFNDDKQQNVEIV